MKYIGFKFPFSFPAGGIRLIKKFKIKLPKDVEKIERVAVILKATIIRDEATEDFKSATHLSFSIGNKKEPASNIVLKEGCDITRGITFTELYKDVYPAGQYISGYFEITREALDEMNVIEGQFTLVLKAT